MAKNTAKPVKLSEKSLQQYICDILRLDGWLVYETDKHRYHHEGKSVRHPLGEVGMADLLCVRYGAPCWFIAPLASTPQRSSVGEILWVETKSPAGRVMPHQTNWHRYMRGLGALTWIIGQDCEASPESWKALYERSGLCRRKLQ